MAHRKMNASKVKLMGQRNKDKRCINGSTKMNGKGCFCLFDLILYVPSTIVQLNRDGSSLVEPVLS